MQFTALRQTEGCLLKKKEEIVRRVELWVKTFQSRLGVARIFMFMCKSRWAFWMIFTLCLQTLKLLWIRRNSTKRMIDHTALVNAMMCYSEQQFIRALRRDPERRSMQVRHHTTTTPKANANAVSVSDWFSSANSDNKTSSLLSVSLFISVEPRRKKKWFLWGANLDVLRNPNPLFG